jgi:hypothetical protein
MRWRVKLKLLDLYLFLSVLALLARGRERKKVMAINEII